MLVTLDLAAVLHFTSDLNERLRRCDDGEGRECTTLEQSINHYVQLCEELQQGVEMWARAVFSGAEQPDTAIETLLKDQLRLVIISAKRVAERGYTTEGPCYYFVGLNSLYRHIHELEELAARWVSPRLSVGPAARTKIPSETEQVIKEQLTKLQPLPSDWQPADSEQAAYLRKQVDR